MSHAAKIGLGLGALLAVLGLAACSGSPRIRVYVEPTYEQDRLQKLLARHPDVKVLPAPGTEEITLRVEALPEELEAGQLPRAAIRARALRNGYEVYAVAQFLRVRNGHGGRVRWVSSYSEGVREDDMDTILHEVVLEAAHQEHQTDQHTPEEVDRALLSATPTS